METWKSWRSRTDGNVHLIVLDGLFDALPDGVRKLGPWSCTGEGEVARLRPGYRALVSSQGFVLVAAELKDFVPER